MVGDVCGKIAILVDDILDDVNVMVNAARVLYYTIKESEIVQ